MRTVILALESPPSHAREGAAFQSDHILHIPRFPITFRHTPSVPVSVARTIPACHDLRGCPMEMTALSGQHEAFPRHLRAPRNQAAGHTAPRDIAALTNLCMASPLPRHTNRALPSVPCFLTRNGGSLVVRLPSVLLLPFPPRLFFPEDVWFFCRRYYPSFHHLPVCLHCFALPWTASVGTSHGLQVRNHSAPFGRIRAFVSRFVVIGTRFGRYSNAESSVGGHT